MVLLFYTTSELYTKFGMVSLAPLTFLPFFQLAAYHLTEELHLWHKHPLVVAFESAVSGKIANYVPREAL